MTTPKPSPQAIEPGVSVVISAFNEEVTIASIALIAARHPLVDEVIVVSDGSTDRTVERARSTGARMIVFEANRGKGMAMDAGVRAARFNTIAFLDADLLGLTPDMLTAFIEPVRSGSCEMFTLVQDRATLDTYHYLPAYLSLGGVRAIARSLWFTVPADDRQGFDVETALNYYARKQGLRTGTLFVPGLGHLSKEKKRGLVRGAFDRTLMVMSFTKTFLKLNLLHLEARHS